MQRVHKKGFSLFELMAVVAIGTIILGLAITGLKRSTVMGGSRGMATAVAAELRLAREKAIAKGSPVAVAFAPGVSRSLFTLEGDTDPVVTRVVNYQGDYPHGAIAVATYPGPNFGPAENLIGSKSTAWQARVNDWLPTDFTNHNVFMFTPNGSVVTNGLPAADGSYRLIVAMGIETSGPALSAAGEPYTLAISQSGAVEYSKGLLGGSGGINTVGAASPIVAAPPKLETSHSPQAPNIIHSLVTPPAELVDGDWLHVLDKGEYLTLELYAQSLDGKPLYAGWIDTPLTQSGDQYKGRFSIPVDGGGPVLERMEFFPRLEVEKDRWENDVWRSVWTWTPPHLAEAGDQYSLMADVKDSTFEVSAELPSIPPVEIAPPGDILFESNRNGRWHLFTMWADGSRVRQLTEGNHDHRNPSVTANGEMVAYERNGNQIWIMNIDGTGKFQVGTGRVPTISPLGNVIAYMHPTNNTIIVKRIDTGATQEIRNDTVATVINGDTGGAPIHNRLAFSPNGRVLYYTADQSVPGRCVASVTVTFSGAGLSLGPATYSDPVTNIADVGNPALGGLYTCRNSGRVYYHADGNDPYIGYFEPDGDGHLRGDQDHHRTSVNFSDAFPAPSPGGDVVLFNTAMGGLAGPYQIFSVPFGSFTNLGAGKQLTTEGINLRPVWISQRGGF